MFKLQVKYTFITSNTRRWSDVVRNISHSNCNSSHKIDNLSWIRDHLFARRWKKKWRRKWQNIRFSDILSSKNFKMKIIEWCDCEAIAFGFGCKSFISVFFCALKYLNIVWQNAILFPFNELHALEQERQRWTATGREREQYAITSSSLSLYYYNL